MFRLAHLSDPHLKPPDANVTLGDLFSKRTLSRLSWREKQRQHDSAVLAAITADMAAHSPEHIVLTGDLTNFATTDEFAAARVWLATLGPAADVTVSPGNHDALVSHGHAERFASLEPWFGDGAEEGFPHVRRRGHVAIINLCSALPTAPAFATGRLGRAQFDALPAILDGLNREGLFRVLILHHPPVQGVVSRRQALDDAPALLAILARHGAELILHGHAHEAAFNTAAGPTRRIPVLGAPSASMPYGHRHPAARWHGLEIEDGAVTVVARGLSAGMGAVSELGRYRLPAAIR